MLRNGVDQHLFSDLQETRAWISLTTATGCSLGSCQFACDAGFADCNSNLADGCEIDLNNDATRAEAFGSLMQPVAVSQLSTVQASPSSQLIGSL